MADAAYLLAELPGWATFWLPPLLPLPEPVTLDFGFSVVAFGASLISGTDFSAAGFSGTFSVVAVSSISLSRLVFMTEMDLTLRTVSRTFWSKVFEFCREILSIVSCLKKNNDEKS